MFSSETTTIDQGTIAELADRIEAFDAGAVVADLPVEEVQRIFTAAFHLYARLAEERSIGDPFTQVNEITATQVVTTALAILHSQNLEVFELALWQSWGGTPWKNEKEEAK
ncbi:hypothetical protein [Agromyces archimandritae]|uniref:Uncharacterized protein n=1 Tax=Agromyces archimandritae TaxID=2781962 RepID=A0A975FM11_9MICO|nr:hypothetical protein [Agromyces archimandritae]QTX04391.1 hypothetical protein G127AT_14130 [Agromyces archimandritae]